MEGVIGARPRDGADGALVNRDKVQKTPEITRSSYSGTFGLERKDYKIETNFEISNDKLFGDYNYELAGVIYTGKLYDAKRVSNRLELIWEEKSGGKVYKGKLVIDIGIDWSEFNGIYYYNNGKIGGTWTGKLKNNKKSVIEYYLNLPPGRIFLPKNGNKQFLLNKWWGFDNYCEFIYLWDEEGNEYGLYDKKQMKNPMQRYIYDKWWIYSYGKPDIGENKIKGKYIEIEKNIFSYGDTNYKFKTKNNKTVLVLEYLEYYTIDKQGNKIKEDVSEWGENELFQCKINNIRETKEFSDQLEHIKKMFNKK